MIAAGYILGLFACMAIIAGTCVATCFAAVRGLWIESLAGALFAAIIASGATHLLGNVEQSYKAIASQAEPR